jgi:putative inorganic carbon (hco3(-)) transporter
VTAELARAGGVIGALGLAVLIVAPTRAQRLAGLGAWALGALLLAIYLLPEGHRPLLAAVAVLGLGVAAGGAAPFHRWPWLLPLVALPCVAARIHVTVGATEANLLVPMYAVVAAAALALGWQLRRRARTSREAELGLAAWPLAAFVGWSGLSILWTGDLRQGAIDLLFFYLPFGLLALVLARLPWRRLWAIGLLAELVGLALVFAGIGIYQYETRNIFWNPKVEISNAYAPFYRVNSVFWDPSIYGRFLVVAILACLVAVLFARDRRVLVGGTAAIGVIWIGLFFSYSQSSFAALAAGVVLAAIFAWGRRGLALAAIVAVVVAAGAPAIPNVRHDVFGNGRGLNSSTGGRGTLVKRGVRIAVHHPVAGVGIGGFKHAYADLANLRGRDPKAAASHTTPVTVAAETGLPGLALYAWLLVAAFGVAFRRSARDLPGLVALGCTLVLAAIAVHSLFYNAFFEDPTVWGAIGIAAVATRQPLARRRDEPADAPQLDRQVEPERQQHQRVDGAQPESAGERDVEHLPEHR